MEWRQSLPREIVAELLDARLVADRGEQVVAARAGLGRIFTAIPVHLVEMLGLGVVRLEIAVGDRPCRRETAVMANLAEVTFAQPEQRRSIKFRVAAHVVVRVRMQRLAVLVVPHLFGVVLRLDVDGA